jgi:hypothetical protein
MKLKICLRQNRLEATLRLPGSRLPWITFHPDPVAHSKKENHQPAEASYAVFFKAADSWPAIQG